MNKDQKNPEKEILEGIFSHDNNAWEKFIDVYGRLIYYSIHKTTLRKGIKIIEHDLEDLYQDFLLSLIEKNFKKLRSFRFECSLKTWLTILATRFTLIYANKAMNKPQPKPLATEYEKVQSIIESLRDQGLDPEGNFEEKENRRLIQTFIEKLDPINKVIFNLYFLEEKTAKEIISAKAIPRATVYRKISNLQKDFLDFYRNS